MRFLAKTIFSEITFLMLTHMYFDCAISKLIFWGEMIRKLIFSRFRVNNAILGHFLA
jgi:hypothetical protein